MSADDRSRYLDRCDQCHARVAPVQVRKAENGHGEIADYLCLLGHMWSTGWYYGDGTSARRAA